MQQDVEERAPAVSGTFYPDDPAQLRELVNGFLAEAAADRRPARAVILPHAGLVYSGQCAAHVLARIQIPPTIVLIGPNHRGVVSEPFGASLWERGGFTTPLGRTAIAADLATRLAEASPLVGSDRMAHAAEHSLEVQLPFLQVLAPETRIVPILLTWDDWESCEQLAAALADAIGAWPGDVLLAASSDMTHYESAQAAERKDGLALAAVERLDGKELLETCRRERVTMCGRAPSAVVLEAARRLGASGAEVVDYRNSGWVTGDLSSVVAYAGVLIS